MHRKFTIYFLDHWYIFRLSEVEVWYRHLDSVMKFWGVWFSDGNVKGLWYICDVQKLSKLKQKKNNTDCVLLIDYLGSWLRGEWTGSVFVPGHVVTRSVERSNVSPRPCCILSVLWKWEEQTALVYSGGLLRPKSKFGSATFVRRNFFCGQTLHFLYSLHWLYVGYWVIISIDFS